MLGYIFIMYMDISDSECEVTIEKPTIDPTLDLPRQFLTTVNEFIIDSKGKHTNPDSESTEVLPASERPEDVPLPLPTPEENHLLSAALSEEEQRRVDIMVINIERYMQNSIISVLSTPDEVTSQVLNNVLEVVSARVGQTDTISRLSERESVLFETMVGEMRNGNAITVYQSSGDSSVRADEYFAVTERSVSEVHEQESTPRGIRMTEEMFRDPNFLNHRLFQPTGSDSISQSTKGSLVEQETKTGKAVILSYPAEQPAPLPSWTYISEAPSHDQPYARES